MNKYIEKLKINKNVKNIYLFGSKVYKTDNENSDFDYIIVCNKKDKEQIVLEDMNISFYEIDEWEYFAKENDVKFIECIFLNKEFKIKETYIPKFEINKEKLHSSFSRVASNSFVKMKKKLTVDKDYNPYIAKKSLFHSLRLLMFANHILKYNNIDYQEANYLYDEIVNNESNDWQYYHNKYKPIYNKLKSKLRILSK